MRLNNLNTKVSIKFAKHFKTKKMRCKHKKSCGHDICILDECSEFEEKVKKDKVTPKSILINQIQQLSGVENVSHLPISKKSEDFMVVEIYLDPVSVCNRLTPEEVQRRNYNANVRRGKITDKTTKLDFAYKALEEVNELIESINNGDEENERTERADIVHVIEAMSYHDGFDLQAEKERKMKINETRTD